MPAGFPNDSFPARLTSGETIIDRSQSSQLQDFLDSQAAGNKTTQAKTETSAPQAVTINLQIGESQLAQVLLNLNRQGFRVSA